MPVGLVERGGSCHRHAVLFVVFCGGVADGGKRQRVDWNRIRTR